MISSQNWAEDVKGCGGAILVGNTFSLTLLRRAVRVEPIPLDALRRTLAARPVRSFWGHANTLQAANALLGVDVTPRSSRPALTLTADGLPSFDGEVFRECFVLSPDYRHGYRPAMGAEVRVEDIAGWRLLRVAWQ